MSDYPIGFLGEIRMFAGSFAPNGWALCDGSALPISLYEQLYNLLGNAFGGDGNTTFALPDLRGRVPLHMGNGSGLTPRTIGWSGGNERVTLSAEQMPAHSHVLSGVAVPATDRTPNQSSLLADSEREIYAPPAHPVAMSPSSVATAGGGSPHDNMQPFACVTFIIAIDGVYPSVYAATPLPRTTDSSSADAYTGEIKLFAGDYTPPGWMTCDGQRLLIGKNGALFAVVGTTYGGNGREFFALPDLRGRVPVHPQSSRPLGDAGGNAAVTLTGDTIPAHSHSLAASSAAANSTEVDGNMLGTLSGDGELYAANAAAADLVPLSPKTLAPSGGGQAHNNMQPYLTVTFMICVEGYDPRTGL